MPTSGNASRKPETPALVGKRWAQSVATQGKVVGTAADLPSQAAVNYLETQGALVRVLDGAVWVLRDPKRNSETEAVLGAYWLIMAELLKTYDPAAIDRVSAIRLMLGEATPPDTLTIRQGRNASKRNYTLPGGLRIRLLPIEENAALPAVGRGEGEAQLISVGGVELSVMAPAWMLLAIPMRELRDEMPRISAWLKHLSLPVDQLEAVYRLTPRPYVAARIAKLADELGNRTLAADLNKVIQAHSVRPLTAARVRMPEAPIPAGVTQAPHRQAPWRTRFEDQLDRGLTQLLSIAVPASPRMPQSELREFARLAKREDVYHSTTIEGYRVTAEDLKALNDGAPDVGATPEERERRLALLGYAHAFDEVLERFPEHPAPMDLNLDRIRECYADLWQPSVDAGVVTLSDLWAFRNRPAFLNGSRFVPPAPEKIWDLLEALARFLRERTMSGAVRAALGHWGFETVHPFVDGNGRVGRLLMNAALGAEGYPWVTIRAEDRARYFRALEQAQVDEDFRGWGAFFSGELERAIDSALKWSATQHVRGEP